MRAEIRDGEPSEASSELSDSTSVAVSVAVVSTDESLEFLMVNLSGFGIEVMVLKDVVVVFGEVGERKLLRRTWTAVDGTDAAAMVVLIWFSSGEGFGCW